MYVEWRDHYNKFSCPQLQYLFTFFVIEGVAFENGYWKKEKKSAQIFLLSLMFCVHFKKCLILYYFEILMWKLGFVWQMGILRQDAGNKIVSMSSPVPAVIKIVSSKLAFYSIFNSWIETKHPMPWRCHTRCVHYCWWPIKTPLGQCFNKFWGNFCNCLKLVKTIGPIFLVIINVSRNFSFN